MAVVCCLLTVFAMLLLLHESVEKDPKGPLVECSYLWVYWHQLQLATCSTVAVGFIPLSLQFFCRPVEFLDCDKPEDFTQNKTHKEKLNYGCTKVSQLSLFLGFAFRMKLCSTPRGVPPPRGFYCTVNKIGASMGARKCYCFMCSTLIGTRTRDFDSKAVPRASLTFSYRSPPSPHPPGVDVPIVGFMNL